MKKKKRDNKINYVKYSMIFMVMFCIIIAMTTYWIYAYNHKYGEYKDTFIKYKIDNYTYVDGDIIYLKNISKEINNEFVDKQKEVLKGNNVYTTIDKNIEKDILSIKISYVYSNIRKAITFNYDLKEKKVLDNEMLLKYYNVTYSDIASDIFDNYIKLSGNGNVTDAISDKEISYSDFNANRDKYIVRIREVIYDKVNLYINNGLYYNINLDDIFKVCYYTDKKSGNIDKLIVRDREGGI